MNNSDIVALLLCVIAAVSIVCIGIIVMFNV